MSFKTDRLVNLIPEAYAATEKSSLLHKLLDAAGAEYLAADDAIKALLKSHWIDYAQGPALDGLGAIFRAERRRLPDGSDEPDEAFRLRLRSVVPLFTGGGTRRAVLGAVRSALGLPFDLKQLNLPAPFAALEQDLEALVTLEEFSPNAERLVDEITSDADVGEITLEVPVSSVRAEFPRIAWTMTRGSGRRLRLERLDSGQGVESGDSFIVPEGQTLFLSAGPAGSLRAFMGGADVSSSFASIGGGSPLLPPVPRISSTWRFTSQSALFDQASFDGEDSFDRPRFRLEMNWRSYQPLTFDVSIPFFLKTAVERLKQTHGFSGQLFVFEGLDLETIQDVVDQTRAAGVRGRVHFALFFPLDSQEGLRTEMHDQSERFSIQGLHQAREDAATQESFSVGSINEQAEDHGQQARFGVGGVFDLTNFDQSTVFH